MGYLEKYELKLLWPFYLESLLSSMFFFFALFGILYFRDLGFSLTQIGTLLAMQSLAIFLFEIPTGAIADIYGRKFSVILGCFLIGMTFISIGFVTHFYLLCILFFFWGLFFTFTSGSLSAWFVDLLKKKKQGKKVHDLNSLSTAIISLGMIISGVIGSLLVQFFGLWITWPFTGIGFLLSALVLSFAQEDFVRKEFHLHNSWNKIFRQMKDCGNVAYTNDNIFYLILGGVLVFSATYFAGDLLFFPLIKDAGLPDYAFGYLISVCFSLGVLVPLASKKLIKTMGGSKKYLLSLLVLLFLFTAPILFLNHLYAYIAIYVIGYFLFLFYEPIRFSFFHSYLPSKKRATIDSIRSMVYSFVGIILIPLVGYTADTLGAKTAIFIGALLYIPAILMYMKVQQK